MSHTYSGDPDNWVEDVTIIDDDDDADAASIDVPFEALLDRTAYLHKPHLGSARNRSLGQPRYESTYWERSPSSSLRHWTTAGYDIVSARTPPFALAYDIPVSHLSTLNKVTVYYAAPPAHGALPQFQPQIVIVKQDFTTGVESSVGSASDAAGSVGVYESGIRTLECTVTESIDLDTYKYHAYFYGERGTNAIAAGLIVVGASYRFIPGQYPGGL